MAFLGLTIIFGLGTIYGAYISIPLVLEGYKPHKSTDMNGLITFIGLLLLVPTFLAGALTLAFGALFWQEEQKEKTSLPQTTDPTVAPSPKTPNDPSAPPAA